MATVAAQLVRGTENERLPTKADRGLRPRRRRADLQTLGGVEVTMRTETTILTDRGTVVFVPCDLLIIDLAVALSYVGGQLRWNQQHRRLEIVNPFRGVG